MLLIIDDRGDGDSDVLSDILQREIPLELREVRDADAFGGDIRQLKLYFGVLSSIEEVFAQKVSLELITAFLGLEILYCEAVQAKSDVATTKDTIAKIKLPRANRELAVVRTRWLEALPLNFRCGEINLYTLCAINSRGSHRVRSRYTALPIRARAGGNKGAHSEKSRQSPSHFLHI